MAFDKEFLAPFFQGAEKADEIIGAIIAEHEKVNLPLVKNKDDILAEKKQVEKKLAELQEKYTALETTSKELNEKLESGLPDKEKQILLNDVEKYKNNIVKITEEANKMKTEYEEKIGNLTKEKTDYIIGEEFTKLVDANAAIFPDMKDGLKKRFFADYPKASFEPFEYNGKQEYVIGGKKMSDLLTDFFNTPEGKRYLQETSNGGGAPGSGGSKGFQGKNPWAKDSRNLTEQGRILQENPNLAKTLMAQAGANQT